MSLRLLADTICALSTPPGKSALAVIRLTGPEAITISAKILSDPNKLLTALGGTSIYTDVLTRSGETLDDVIVTVFRSPKSYTGEDIVEITSHGSEIITSEIVNLLTSYGARLAEPGEFSRRAWMNGKLRLEEVERIALRVDAPSEQILFNAQHIIEAKFKRLQAAYDTVIEALAFVNAEIDFGESDQIDAGNVRVYLNSANEQLNELLASSSNKALDKGYVTVALIGPPNVGKSSIFNALLRYERSIVSHVPGTTRDYVEASMSLGGRRIRIIDTAGIRTAGDEIESRGIALGQSAQQEADIVLHITDPSTRDVLVEQNEIVVHNKCDIDGYHKGICISALNDEISALVEFLARTIDNYEISETSLAISAGEAERLRNVLDKLVDISYVQEPALLAEQLREASDSIGELLGLRAGEMSLEYIFNKMCIGK